MKKIMITVCLATMLGVYMSCSESQVLPKQIQPATTAAVSGQGKHQSTSGRLLVPGKLVWNSTFSRYEADWGTSGLLYFSGPNPLPTNGTIPVFYVLGSNVPGNIMSIWDTSVNHFHISMAGTGGSNSGEIEVAANESGGIDIEMEGTYNPITLGVDVDGAVVKFNGDYYAIAIPEI